MEPVDPGSLASTGDIAGDATPPSPDSPPRDLTRLPRGELEAMLASGAKAVECMRVLTKGCIDLVS
ncbi:MAG: hypothetical protein ABI920_13235, partial [Casimicrobiaceae bacterium]